MDLVEGIVGFVVATDFANGLTTGFEPGLGAGFDIFGAVLIGVDFEACVIVFDEFPGLEIGLQAVLFTALF